MRILITGSQGQLGTELRQLLGSSHHEVLGVDLVGGDSQLDLSDRDVVLGCVTGWQPELILHGAAFTAVDRCEEDPELAYRANALATRFIADGARRVGAHVVYVSTDYVFDGSKTEPYVEWDTPNPRSVYGRTKRAGEMEIDPAWSIARTSWVCSAHGNNMVKTIMRLAAEHDELSFVDDQFGHPTFASDLAAMVLRLGVERVPGIFHTTNQGVVSWHGFAQAVLQAAGADPARVRAISTAELTPPRPAERPMYSVLGDLAWRGHGFPSARDFREPLAEVVAALES